MTWTAFRARWRAVDGIGKSIYVMEDNEVNSADYLLSTILGNDMSMLTSLSSHTCGSITSALRGVDSSFRRVYLDDHEWRRGKVTGPTGDMDVDIDFLTSGRVVLVFNYEMATRPVKWAYYALVVFSESSSLLPFTNLFLELPLVHTATKLVDELFLVGTGHTLRDVALISRKGSMNSLDLLLRATIGTNRHELPQDAIVLTIEDQEARRIPERMIFK